MAESSHSSKRCAAADGLAQRREAGSGFGRVLVVGLGGGALPMYLHDALGLSVDCVELDPAVAGLARRHFGFADVASLPSLTVRLPSAVSRLLSIKHGAPGFSCLQALVHEKCGPVPRIHGFPPFGAGSKRCAAASVRPVP